MKQKTDLFYSCFIDKQGTVIIIEMTLYEAVLQAFIMIMIVMMMVVAMAVRVGMMIVMVQR